MGTGTAPGVPEEAALQSEQLPRGTALGRYLILSPLGAGGLGIVYTAYDPELDRKVAVKVIRAGATDLEDEARLSARLRREAKSLAKVTHPNVVGVFDIGFDFGRVYIAMELVEGLTLRQWWKHKKRSWQEIRDAFIKAAAGLEAAHRAGLVHRDFKPGNVMVSDAGDVRVLDFGLARALGSHTPVEDVQVGPAMARPIDDDVTKTGLQIGTPAYMAPEQHQGHNAGPRSDQFSFAVSLFEALYGQRPFAGKTSEELLQAIARGDLAEGLTTTPPFMLRALRRALALDPNDRFENMGQLSAALQGGGSKKATGWLVGIAAVGLLVAGGVGAQFLVGRAEATEATQPDRVQQLVRQARDAAARAAFVYPPAEEPKADTAYVKVIELERDGSDPALEAAATLRDEFSDTLLRQADSLWERPGGAPFAAELYAQASLFRAAERAAARSMLTPAQLASLTQIAEARTFTDAQLDAAESVRLLLFPEDAQKPKRLAELEREGRLSPVTEAALRKLLGVETGRPRSSPRPPAPKAIEPQDRAEPSASEMEESDPAPVAQRDPELDRRRPAARRQAGPRPKSEPEPESAPSVPERPELEPAARDPAAAAELAKQGTGRLKSGDLKTAGTYFHRALKADPRNTAALSGLAKVAFERGEHVESARHAAKAVRLAPNNSGYRMQLGNAYYRLLRYDDALREFEKARDLGSPRAQRSINKIRDLLGQ